MFASNFKWNSICDSSIDQLT